MKKKSIKAYVLAMALCIALVVSLIPMASFAVIETATTTIKASDAKAGDIVYFGSYPQTASGGVEPIAWHVLSNSDGQLFLLSEKVLDCKPYNTSPLRVTWETCSLRTWLNADFYNTAFSASEKSYIAQTTVDNPNTPLYGSYISGGNTTFDWVFLLKLGDTGVAYGFSNSYSTYDTARQAKATEYAKAQGVFTSTSNDYYGNASWWLRSPGTGIDLASVSGACVYLDGSVSYIGRDVDSDGFGVRPVLYLFNLDSLIFESYEQASLPATDAPLAPTLASKNENSVTLNAYTGAEYSKDGTSWQASPVFTGLSPKTAYNFYQRLAATDTALASPASEALTVTTDKGAQAKPEDKVTSIRTPLTKLNIVRGKTYTPVIVVDGDKVKPTYKSSNPTVAKVDSNSGKITAVKVGKAVITATAGSKSVKITVNVVAKASEVKSLKVNIPGSLKKGKTAVLKPQVNANATGVKYTFTSSKPSVVSVDKAGKLTAKAKGKAVITVKAGSKIVKKTVVVK